MSDSKLHTHIEPIGTFGWAIEEMKLGNKVCRGGWNGKDMWITMGAGGLLDADKFWNKHTREFANSQPNKQAVVCDYIIMKTVDGRIVMGWLASQTDMLSEDWEIA